METVFHIVLTLKTPDGYTACGKFCLGKNREFAQDVFAKLTGDDVKNGTDLLCMDLVEMKNELPLDLIMRTCTLEQVGYNCQVITKELFKEYNLKET